MMNIIPAKCLHFVKLVAVFMKDFLVTGFFQFRTQQFAPEDDAEMSWGQAEEESEAPAGR